MNLHSLARGGVISAAEAGAIGLSGHDLAALAKTGAITRLLQGWYAVNPTPGTPAPWTVGRTWQREQALHRLRVTALLRDFEGRALASHDSAVLVLGGRSWGADLSTVHVQRTGHVHGRRRQGVHIHGSIDLPSPLQPASGPDGLAAVHPAVAAVQLGLIRGATGDRDPLRALVCADGFLHGGTVTVEQLDLALGAFEGHRGVAAVRRMLRAADARHASVGETRTAAVLRALGYRFSTQVRVDLDPSHVFLDFALDDESVAIEFDGRVKYPGDEGGEFGRGDGVGSNALFEEKNREDALRRMGWGFARVIWSDLDRPTLVQRKVEAAREQARRYRRAG